ncbi:sulfate transporter CysZ [Colwellia sp. 4_MG-2023]|jgi:CysZ protein|uniref:sulfate transporter CysZ n=1 Tax=unclassified Colwellia TaxID=196834 RepID=UPI001C092770|nr:MULTISPECIES: sulfate transporter CysZ [unclassified Colwellia]MBU2924566.1 sulfate transporter CysZ [Colwellia sp. C2M11]MDO6489035.1 sulfate transporter CysZ [Colwellia sp. 6_MG-2023]MDO6508370.1 sulfate transporter CysZ [Colwellia sp. 5_MG-2023]MDO6556984.1 sulfate transporter CysZ [Colwellia sp. 4_MG-2023]MDO6653959.1 sulfate transporter CysZ [Colwellia sp. 3_MG-2023]
MSRYTNKQFTNKNSPLALSGAGYLFKGFELIRLKGIRRFVFIPLLVNLVLFSCAFYYIYRELEHYMQLMIGWLPSWLDWLSAVLWPLAVITVLIVFSFLFSTAANWLAAPFNGLLSEKIEHLLVGETGPSESMLTIVKDTPRALGREWTKLVYYIPRAIGFFVLMWILPVIGQVIWFLFVAWMMAIQYKDYPFDNHKISFFDMKQALKKQQGLSYSFGITVTVFAMIPIVNLIIMPVAICGATALWVDHYRKDFL